MRDRPACWLLVVELALTVPGVQAADDPRLTGKDISGLVNQLGSERYAEREAAARALAAVGAPALEALRKAARHREAEVRRRAERLLRQIETRLEMQALLAPRRVRLTYRETPLPEALADFGKQAEVSLVLDGDRDQLLVRKITLETGTVSFWEALDQFCSRAGLMLALDAPPPRDAIRASMTFGMGGFRPYLTPLEPRDVLRPPSEDRPASLRLLPGKWTPLPTHYAGAVRVQAVPLDRLGDIEKSERETVVALEVVVEPALKWQRALDLRFHKAIDGQGCALTASPVALPSLAYAPQQAAVYVRTQLIIPPEEVLPPAPQQIPVRLRGVPKTSRRLQELTGTVLLQLQTPVQPLVRVDQLRRSTNQKVRGLAESSVCILDVRAVDDGQVRLRVQVEATALNLRDNSIPQPTAAINIDGRVLGDEPALNSSHFSLLDDRGVPFQVVKAVATGKRAGGAQEYELTYQPGARQGEAARFIYRDRRTVLVEVPFTLKDVPLP
jgi:hypothetical protein